LELCPSPQDKLHVSRADKSSILLMCTLNACHVVIFTLRRDSSLLLWRLNNICKAASAHWKCSIYLLPFKHACPFNTTSSSVPLRSFLDTSAPIGLSTLNMLCPLTNPCLMFDPCADFCMKMYCSLLKWLLQGW
jgi:hypothetical protein